jgi:hypothetical protein
MFFYVRSNEKCILTTHLYFNITIFFVFLRKTLRKVVEMKEKIFKQFILILLTFLIDM